MSADNGIYIHKFKDGYRVVHGQCIENIHYNAGKDGYNHKELNAYFRGGKLFKTHALAWKYAQKLYKDYDFVEYGICEV